MASRLHSLDSPHRSWSAPPTGLACVGQVTLMPQLTLLNATNVLLGLATAALWICLGIGLVQELIDRRRQRTAKASRPALRLVAPTPRRAA
jgi:hypothetical protein